MRRWRSLFGIERLYIAMKWHEKRGMTTTAEDTRGYIDRNKI